MSPFARSSFQIAIEDRCRTRLRSAKRTYDLAVAQFQSAAEQYRARTIPSPDGGLSLHKAIAAESQARKEYMRVLGLFTDLVVHGKIPPEDQPRD